jgi:hypothetical protein
MKLYSTVLFAVATAVVLSGCATKRFDRLQPVSSTESAYLNCREINIELAKVAEARKQIADGSKMDMAAVAGFLGDFGIGNAMEKNAAERTVSQRETQLLALKTKKSCS